MSAAVTNPMFSANSFFLPIQQHKLEQNPRLQFAAFVVTDRKENAVDLENKGQARLLGECVLELGPLMSALNDIYGVGVRQYLSLGRKRDDKEVTVGRFTCIIKLVVRIVLVFKTVGRLHD